MQSESIDHTIQSINSVSDSEKKIIENLRKLKQHMKVSVNRSVVSNLFIASYLVSDMISELCQYFITTFRKFGKRNSKGYCRIVGSKYY